VSIEEILLAAAIAALCVLGVLVVLAVTAWIMWRRATREERQLIKRFGDLGLGSKVQLAGRLVTDPRIPLAARIVLPALVLYLALPIDIIPDIIPVVGWLDDVFLLVVGLNIVLRMTPRAVLDEQIAAIERAELDRRALEADRGDQGDDARGGGPDRGERRLLR